MWPVPIVAMKPPRQFGGAFMRSVVSSGVRSFAQARLNEALRLSIGLERVGPGEDLTQTQTLAGCPESFRPVAGAVVGHHAPHLDAEAGVISDGRFEEGDSALFALVGHDLDESDARGIVDADVDELPADAEMAVDRARISPGDAVPHRADPAELLDIEMDELAGMLPFIAAHRFGRFEVFQPRQAGA